jgi:hypothetical protein
LGAPGYAVPAAPATHPSPRADGPDDSASQRLRGPFSDNPEGPPDTGVPARAPERPTAALGQTPEGNQRTLLHTIVCGILLGCGCDACQAALTALGGPVPLSPALPVRGERGDLAVGARTEHGGQRLAARGAAEHGEGGGLAAGRWPSDAALATQATALAQAEERRTLDAIEQRLTALEAQPMPGGPQLRVADKTLPLQPYASPAGQASSSEQFRALAALAGKLTDQQAQLAVATELIRLQQEAAGLPPSLQVMPRAGSGSVLGTR